jgi:hypothetical protein
MRSLTRCGQPAAGVLVFAFSFGAALTSAQTKPSPDKIPITTSSEDARKLYLQGRDLSDKLRATDARQFYLQAVAKDKDFARQVALKKVPFEVRQQHELAGLIALAEKRPSAPIQEFAQANQQDPRILYLTAIAFRDAGDTQKAATFAAKAAKFNALGFNYAYVRGKAASIRGISTE